MRESIKQFVKICAETLPITEPIYEFGAFQVPHQIGFADLRPFFPNKKFIGADMRMGPGVDLVLDLHNIQLPADSAGTVLCFDTLEHVEYPHIAMQEIHRIMNSGSIVLISSVMNFPIHDYPSDYWRFTPEAFKSILRPFSDAFVGYAGQETFPHTVVGIGCKGASLRLDDFLPKYHEWQEYWLDPEGRTEDSGGGEDSSEQAQLTSANVTDVPPEIKTAVNQEAAAAVPATEHPVIKAIKLFAPPVLLLGYRKIYWKFHDRAKGKQNGQACNKD